MSIKQNDSNKNLPYGLGSVQSHGLGPTNGARHGFHLVQWNLHAIRKQLLLKPYQLPAWRVSGHEVPSLAKELLAIDSLGGGGGEWSLFCSIIASSKPTILQEKATHPGVHGSHKLDLMGVLKKRKQNTGWAGREGGSSGKNLGEGTSTINTQV